MSGPGPRGVIEPPLLTPPVLSLWSMAQHFEGVEADEQNWGGGVAFYPESCGGDVDTHATGCDPETGQVVSPTKPVPVPRDIVEFDPFTIVGVEQCSTFSRRNEAEYRARALRALDACWVREFEREFWMGTVADNPHLASGAEVDDLTSATALDVAEGVATLEETLADCLCGGQGMIHMSRRAFSLISGTELVQIPAAGVATTKLGTLLVPGAGYPGNAPDGLHDAAKEYLYATGMVKVARGVAYVVPGDLSEALNRQTNTITYYAELAAIAVFDPCCLLGVQVDVPGGGGS